MIVKAENRLPITYDLASLAKLFRDFETQVNLASLGRIQAASNAAAAAPTTGTYQKGDFIRSSSPTKAGTVGSRYIIIGFVCTVAGTPGTWEEVHVLTEDITFTAAATQAEQETGTSTTVFVSPGRQQFHQSAAKAWVNFNGTGTVAIRASYNVSSITDNGAGDWTVNYTTSFSSANYGFSIDGSIYNDGTAKQIFLGVRDTHAPAAASIRVETLDVGAASNPDASCVSVVCFGDQ